MEKDQEVKKDSNQEEPESYLRNVKKWDSSDIAAFSAVLISLAALFIGLYEAKIMKEQQVIMGEQQRAAVWPYLEKNTSFSYAENSQLILRVENKGVGPAIMKDVYLLMGTDTVREYVQFFTQLDKYFDPNNLANVSFGMSKNFYKVLKPGEELTLLNLELKRFENDNTAVGKFSPKLHYTYCSIFDECWDETGDKIE